MHDADRIKLLHGPYTAPALKRGDKATCLFRDAEVVLTSWSDGRIPWPRCRLPSAGNAESESGGNSIRLSSGPGAISYPGHCRDAHGRRRGLSALHPGARRCAAMKNVLIWIVVLLV